jgi:glycine/D-amino acid oxidase-like deaminating enzyme
LRPEADVVVVGGGYTGVAAATYLARSGKVVVVLEKDELGFGASSRNGGMVLPGFKVGLATLVQRFGDRGKQLYQSTLDAIRLLEQTIAANGIVCDYEPSGHLHLAHRSSHLAQISGEARLLHVTFGLKTQVLSGADLVSEVGSPEYAGGMVFEGGGGLHPARYFTGLVRVALAAGARLHDHLPALAIERAAGGFKLQTPRGSIQCAEVLVATNGYTDAVAPALRRRVIPIGSYIIATEPLAQDQVVSLIPHRRMLFDSKNFLYYWRLSADNRMLFGGRASFAPTTIPKARDWLYAAMLRVHPQLQGVSVEHAWGGKVGFTMDRMPHIGRLDGVTYALGYCGIGVAMSTYFGRLAADWIGGGQLPDCWQRPFPAVPLYRGNPWFLPAVGAYYAALDRI